MALHRKQEHGQYRSSTTIANHVRSAAGAMIADAKRSRVRQSGIEAWFPYYAGYSESFAREVIRAVAPQSPLVILDPWNGSGTTTRVAHQLGHLTFGFDLNPVLSVVASAKLAHPGDVKYVTGLARRLAAVDALAVDVDDPLLAWLPEGSVSEYRAIETALLRELASSPDGLTLHPSSGELPPLASFLILGLMRAAKQTAGILRTTNPTWFRPSGLHQTAKIPLGAAWKQMILHMASTLTEQEPQQGYTGRLGVANSRNLPIDDESVDFVLTSPPYCTRIDYVVNCSFELAAMAIGPQSEAFTTLRRSMMGGILTRGPSWPQDTLELPESVISVLRQIRTHPSKASHSYYYKMFAQYFDDTVASLREILRALRKGGVAALIVQSSYYKDIGINLPRLMADCGTMLGFAAEIVAEADVKKVLTQINSRAQRYGAEKRYTEALVVLEKQ